MDFSNVTNISIPEGPVTQITGLEGILWGQSEIDYSKEYFTFAFDWNGTHTITTNHSVEYSTDKTNWTTSEAGNVFEIDTDKLYFRNTASSDDLSFSGIEGSVSTSNVPDLTDAKAAISSDSYYNVQGNILSLIYGDDFTSNHSDFVYFNALLCNDPNLMSASNLVMYDRGRYKWAFAGCNNLSYPPKKIYGGRRTYNFYYAFCNCTMLETAPQIDWGGWYIPYEYEFQGCFYECSSLMKIPNLKYPSNIYCYAYMFYKCNSLGADGEEIDVFSEETDKTTTTIFFTSCCSNMFAYCNSLTKVADFPPINCYGPNLMERMFQDCTSLVKGPSEINLTVSNNYAYLCAYMFLGCTSLTATPKITSTNWTDYIFSFMFYNCTSLVDVHLPEVTGDNTNNSKYACNSMFRGCTGLVGHLDGLKFNVVIVPSLGFYNMFYGCTNLMYAPDFDQYTQLSAQSLQGMFAGCNLARIPNLPTINTAWSGCYRSMFSGNSNLSGTIELPATTLQSNCYSQMFKNTQITGIKVGFTEIAGSTPLANWLSGVTTNGVLYKPSAATYDDSALNLPSTWTVETYD